MRSLLARLFRKFTNRQSPLRVPYRFHPWSDQPEPRQVLSVSSVAPLTALPVLNSNPDAQKQLYLDFNGHAERVRLPGFGDNIKPTDTRGAFSIDADKTTFSDAELTAIRSVWEAVGEDFAPFNVNVTTVEPPAASFSNGNAVRVAIGGDDDFWYNLSGDPDKGASGVQLGGIKHVVFVFADDLVRAYSQPSTLARGIASTVSHEAGHAYGLDHQEFYYSDLSQPKAAQGFNPEYNPGQRQGPGSAIRSDWAPIMGDGRPYKRDTWHDGPTSSYSVYQPFSYGPPVRAVHYQDDMSVLGKALGYRADDHASTLAAATWLPTSGNQIQGQGIVNSTSDSDYFAFWHGGGRIRLSVNVAPLGANLDAALEIRSSKGASLAAADPDDSLGAVIEIDLPKGTYHAVVKSHGEYGDVGQYTLIGTGISTAGYSTTGPRVMLSALENPATAPFVRGPIAMLVTFDKPINPGTISTADVTFISPTGRRVAATLVQVVPGNHGNRTYRIETNLTEFGTYRLDIGPNINDAYGNKMDQDGDGIKGESVADRFSTIAVTRRMPSLNNISEHLTAIGWNQR